LAEATGADFGRLAAFSSEARIWNGALLHDAQMNVGKMIVVSSPRPGQIARITGMCVDTLERGAARIQSAAFPSRCGQRVGAVIKA